MELSKGTLLEDQMRETMGSGPAWRPLTEEFR
jgi:hypothetical protein